MQASASILFKSYIIFDKNCIFKMEAMPRVQILRNDLHEKNEKVTKQHEERLTALARNCGHGVVSTFHLLIAILTET